MRLWPILLMLTLVLAGCTPFDKWVDLIEPPDGSQCHGVSPDWCDPDCVDLTSDPQNCGACGFACQVPRGASAVACVEGQCVIEECDENLTDCDEAYGNGCEARLEDSRKNCGACGHACATECIEGTCNDPVEVSAGPTYTCAVRASGSLWCWGSNAWGNLGVGGSDPLLSPHRVALPGPAAAVTTGRFENPMHTCAQLRDGAVYCWGSNAYGQLGVPGLMGSPSPQLVDLPPSAHVAVGGIHTCAVSKAKQVRCWGSNDSGQLGLGMGISGTTIPTIAVSAHKAEDVETGSRHTCARFAEGTVSCWGSNGSGQVGNGALGPIYLPAEIPDAAGARVLGLGTAHTCACFGDGRVKCWGRGADGQLGLDSTDDAAAPQSVPDLFEVIHVGAGLDSTVVLRAGWQEAWAWGANSSAQLGTGDVASTLVPTRTIVGKLQRISIGGRHGCAILQSGALVCWGANESGQLGTGDTKPRIEPIVIPFPSEKP